MYAVADRIDLHENFWLLSGRERAVYFYFFIKGMTFRETGNRIGTCPQRASQLVWKVGKLLRKLYARKPVVDAATKTQLREHLALVAEKENAAKEKARIEAAYQRDRERRKQWEREWESQRAKEEQRRADRESRKVEAALARAEKNLRMEREAAEYAERRFREEFGNRRDPVRMQQIRHRAANLAGRFLSETGMDVGAAQ